MGKNLVAYIRGGLGDIWCAISAIKNIVEKENISKQNILIISDSVYYFRDNYSKELENYSLQMLHKITNNIITVPPEFNNNFWLSKDGKFVDDNTEELSQEEAEKYFNEFMFWRPIQLKNFVANFIVRPKETIFIDAPFTECILFWNGENYERVDNERSSFKFNPPKIEKELIDNFLDYYKKHILIHVRKKKNADGTSPEDNFYQKLIEYCNEKNIAVILLGIDNSEIMGLFLDLRGESPLSFEGMCYLIDNCKVMLGNDSGLTAVKFYQQQKDTMTICNHPRWDRRWYKFLEDNNNKLLDARKDNYNNIIKYIEEFYGN